jgi:hypothetical protein
VEGGESERRGEVKGGGKIKVRHSVGNNRQGKRERGKEEKRKRGKEEKRKRGKEEKRGKD